MSDLTSKHPSIYTIKNIISLHVFLDYFGTKKLHQITNRTTLAATMYQATGSAPGSSGFVNIIDLHGLVLDVDVPNHVMYNVLCFVNEAVNLDHCCYCGLA
ncbi:fasciclin-like arabinogalactan protein 1-like [Trifolium pratense]|uniref:Fasciclin-like arabinogalactan protein 1-like n=1 Tax=Trifolium pratense TaxID=57577 RepID=A0A2K3PPF6_TRIPR|nr:fasciclin-like arabinogalactan protein 1-like [Trifolium pratense]